jgi:hypothetical protein
MMSQLLQRRLRRSFVKRIRSDVVHQSAKGSGSAEAVSSNLLLSDVMMPEFRASSLQFNFSRNFLTVAFFCFQGRPLPPISSLMPKRTGISSKSSASQSIRKTC